MVKTATEQRIIDTLEPLAADRGIDVVDVEIVGATKAPCVRVRLDRLDGEAISLDEVTAQSGWVSDAVEALDPIASSYTLEVSSPGMARPLRRPSDFARFVGESVEVSTTATEGRRKFAGELAASDEVCATIELEDGERAQIPFDQIKKCTLKPVYEFKVKKEGK